MMRKNMPFKFILLAACYLLGGLVKAQSCGSCTVTISGRDTLTYTVSSGNTFCIDSTGRFEGKIILNGGTICNKGTFNPKTFTITTGVITNYSMIKFNSNLTLGSGLTLTNSSRATASINGNLILTGGNFSNAGISTIKNNITYTSGTFTNSAIVNCKILSGSSLGIISNSGVINKD